MKKELGSAKKCKFSKRNYTTKVYRRFQSKQKLTETSLFIKFAHFAGDSLS